MIKKTKEILKNINFENIFIIFIILQPIIDLITSLCVRNISEKLTLGVFIRAIFMIYIALYTLIKINKKDRIKLLIYFIFIAVYCALFIFSSYTKYGFTLIFSQFKGLIKTFYFPVVLSCLLMLLRWKKYPSKYKYINIALAIYVLSIFICKIFNIGYETYPQKPNLGTMGLFFAGNEISAIMAMLSPICFSTFISKKFNIFSALLCVITVFAMLEIGTKVSFFSIIGLIVLTLIISLIKLIREKNKDFYKQFLTIVLITIITFLFVGNTSGGKNLKIKPIFFNKQSITQEKQEKTEKKESQDPEALLSGRNKFLQRNIKSYSSSSILEKFTGIGYIAPKKGNIQERKLVEIDYFDIFFCHGIIGTIIYILPILLVILVSIKNFFKKFAVYIKNNTLIFAIYSVLIGFGTAAIAGHVFTAPSVSMFLALVLLEMYIILYCEKDLKNE